MADIRHAIQISVPAAGVFPLVATAHGWSQWWAADVREANGAIEVGFFKRATLYRLKPLLTNPPVAVSGWSKPERSGVEPAWSSNWKRLQVEPSCALPTPAGAPKLTIL